MQLQLNMRIGTMVCQAGGWGEHLLLSAAAKMGKVEIEGHRNESSNGYTPSI